MAAELLHKLEKLADATSMEGLNGHLGAPIPLNETLLAFDFDQTLSYLPIIEFNGKQTRSLKAELRGGEKTLQLLKKLKEAGCSFCIVTAKCDGKFAIESVASRLKPLGLDEIFDNSSTVKGEVHKVDGIQFAFAGNCVGAAFNKPEAIVAYKNIRSLKARHLVFVDDVADHVLNVRDFLLAKHPTLFEKVTSVWWPIDVPAQFMPKEQSPDAIARIQSELHL